MGIEASIKSSDFSSREDKKNSLSLVFGEISRIDKLLRDNNVKTKRRVELCELQRGYMKQYFEILMSR